MTISELLGIIKLSAICCIPFILMLFLFIFLITRDDTDEYKQESQRSNTYTVYPKKKHIEYFTDEELSQYTLVGYAYIDIGRVLHITAYKERAIGHYVKTTIPFAHGYPIDKNGDDIIVEGTYGANYTIFEKYDRPIPKPLIKLYRACKE